MAETPYLKFRLGPHTVADLSALAAGKGGVLSAAVRDAIHYWRQAVEDAGRANAAEFAPDDWTRLAHLNDPNPLPPGVEDEREPVTVAWGPRLAQELAGVWEGKPLLPIHRDEKKECERLAKRVAKLDLVRGYALYLALSHFWLTPGRGDGEWWHPETFLTPTAKVKEG
jgi:hypothetical protein